MAVTQQIARIPLARLVACRGSVDELDRVCSFKGALERDYLDLNWWPAAFERMGALPGAELAVLARAFEGPTEVNPAYRDHRDTIWEHPVTSLEPAAVAEIARKLRGITPEAVRAAVPNTPSEAEERFGESVRGVEDLAERLARQFAILRDFYDGAARRQLAMVFWWD